MLTSATDNGGTLNYAYYSHGGLKNVVNGSVTLTSSEYNAYGRQTKLIDVNAGTTDYEYNALGQLTWQMNALGQQTTMQYNLAGQVTQRIGVEGTTTYSYGTGNGGGEIKGQIKTVTGFDGTSTTYTYNSLAQLTQLKEVNNGDHITSYTYNSLGDLSTTTYPSGLVITNEYESKGYLKKIRHGSTDLYETTGVNGRGQVTAYTKGNNKNSIINYTHGLPVKYETTGIQNLNLVWDEQKGNLSSRNDAVKSKTETFTYDNLNRLTEVKVGGTTTFSTSYASNGNISSKTDAGTYSYHAAKINAVTGVTNPAPAPIPLLQQDITYTAFMKADKVTENGYELSYSYGADYERNRSVLKQGATTLTTRYYFTGYEKDVTGSTTRYIQYIAGPVGLVAIIESQGSSHTAHYTYTDHLGSILTVTNSSGSIEAEQSFDAWGRRRNPSTWALLSPVAATGLPVWLYRGYTGHEHLDQFGLINMNGRMYDPVLGRMLSPDNFIPDPLFSQDYNRYTYARNNPLVYVDPDGNMPWISMAIGAFVGGFINGFVYAFNDKDFLDGFWRGAISGAVGGLTGYFAPIGALPGMAYGAASGAATGALNSALNGSNVWKGMGWGAALGGISGGIYGGIEANKLKANMWTGARPDHLYHASDALVSGGASAPYSDDYLYKLKNENWKGIGPGRRMTMNDLPKGATMGADGMITTASGERALAVTQSSIWKHGSSSRIYFGKAAFSSREQLAVAMAHEFGHVIHANMGLSSWASELTGNKNPLLNTEGHIAIQKMTGELILKNGWKPGLFSSQVWGFGNAQSYQGLYDPIQFLIKK